VDVALITAIAVSKASSGFYRSYSLDVGIMGMHPLQRVGKGAMRFCVSPTFLLHCVGRGLRWAATTRDCYQMSINKFPESCVPGISLASSALHSIELSWLVFYVLYERQVSSDRQLALHILNRRQEAGIN
jgi:hypothetical protein